MTKPDQLEDIKAWVADRSDRDTIVMDREEVQWLISEVERLREVAMEGLMRHLSRILQDVCTDEGVAIWLDSPNQNLAGERPRDLLELGWHDEVLQEAERLSG